MPNEKSASNKQIYARYIKLLNAQDFDALPEVVDPQRYKEICVGFTPGWVNLQDAITSLRKVLKGIPDLTATIEDVIAEDDKVYARLTVTGTQKGNLYGMPPLGRKYTVNMFDYARLEDGKIVERIQQSDNLGMFGSLFKPVFIAAGVLFLAAVITAIIALAA